MRTQTEVLTYAPNIMKTTIKRWWLQRKLDCCLKNADVADKEADNERRNAAYFRMEALKLAHELRRLS